MRDRVLVMRAGAVGDVVLSFPLLYALGRVRPAASIVLAARTEARFLAGEGGLAGEVRDVSASFFAPLFGPRGAAGRPVAAFIGAFETVIALIADPEGTLRAQLEALGAGVVLALRSLGAETHVARQLFDVAARPLGLGAFPGSEQLVRLARTPAVPLPERFCVIHPGSGGAAKNWPASCFAEVARRAMDCGFEVMVAQGEADANAVAALTGLLGGGVTVLRLPLVDLAAVVSRAAFFVGNDSGITHVAGAVGIPTVAVFGASDPALWRPVGPAVRVAGACGRFPAAAEVCRLAGLQPG